MGTGGFVWGESKSLKSLHNLEGPFGNVGNIGYIAAKIP